MRREDTPTRLGIGLGLAILQSGAAPASADPDAALKYRPLNYLAACGRLAASLGFIQQHAPTFKRSESDNKTRKRLGPKFPPFVMKCQDTDAAAASAALSRSDWGRTDRRMNARQMLSPTFQPF